MKKKEIENKQKQQIEELRKNPVNDFCCLACKDSKSMDITEFKKHLLEVHGLTNDQIKGTKKMTMHIDCEMSFSSQYEWTLESGLKFLQYTEMARSRPMMG